MTMAVFTMVKDEDFFLPQWIKYYSKMFCERDMFILNNGTALEGISPHVNVIPMKHPFRVAFDLNWLRDTVCDFQIELLKTYDWVLYTDVDEFITATPGQDTRFILDSVQHGALGMADVVQFQSRDIVHDPLTEAELNPEQGFLSQRCFWMHRLHMDKPTLARTPVRYVPGFHGFEGGYNYSYATASNLYLIHLARVDYSIAKKRTEQRLEWQWNQKELLSGMAKYNRIPQELFDSWFFDGVQTACSYIPTSWRLVL